MNLPNDSVSLVLGETISNLLTEIVKLPYILQVRAISKYLDGRWIDFEILHNYEDEWIELPPEEIRNQVHDLVFDANLEIREMTGVKFYFHHEFYFGEFPPRLQPQLNSLIAHTHKVIGAKNE